MKYEVCFEGYYSNTVEVDADNREDALAKATVIQDEADANQFWFSDATTTVEEVEGE